MAFSIWNVEVEADSLHERADFQFQTYRADHEFLDHAQDEVSPEDVQAEEDHQHHVEEVVTEEGRVVVNGVDPGTVNEPGTHTSRSSEQLRFNKTKHIRNWNRLSVILILHTIHTHTHTSEIVLPEWENDKSRHHKHDGKQHKKSLAGVLPFCIVE